MSRRLLIVNADDFGLSPAVNRGVEIAHRRGILTSATLLANGPAFAEAVSTATANPELGVGAHLNIMRGRPLSPPGEVGSLVCAGGTFMPLRWRWCSPSVLLEAEREYRRQLERILAAGIRPTHVDFEKHHGWQAGIYGLACRLAREYGIPAIRTLREPVAWSARTLGWPGFRRLAASACLRAASQFLSPGHGVRSPDRLLGQTHIGIMDETAWLRMASALPGGISEAMTHPADGCCRDGEGGMGAEWLGEARRRELSALLSEKVKSRLREAGATLISYGFFSRPLPRADGSASI